MNKISALNVSIQDTTYRTEGNTTYCDMIIKVNLNNFENQFFGFTPTFVKKVISEHLPVVKTVTNYCYSDLTPVVAKYYITPGGQAKVLAFDKNYYKKYRKVDSENLLNVGQMIPVKDIIKTCGECESYDYCQTFTVTGKAVCVPEDEYSADKGKLIASSKAAAKAAQRINRLYQAIRDRIEKMHTCINDEYATSLNWIDQSNKVIESVNNTTYTE